MSIMLTMKTDKNHKILSRHRDLSSPSSLIPTNNKERP